MKKLIYLIIVTALTISIFAGCNATAILDTSDAKSLYMSSSGDIKPVELQLSIWGNDSHKKMYEEMFERYKKNNPNVSIDVLIIPFTDYQQKISIMKASGHAPDIAWLSDIMIPHFLETNQLIDISNLSKDENYRFDDINPSTFDPVKKDGKYYGVAFSTPPVLLYYNKNIFKQKNLRTPLELYKAGKWDYEEFLKAANKITDRSRGVYGIKLMSDWKNWYIYTIDLVWGFGGDVFSSDMKTFTLNSPEGEQAIQMYHDMIFRYGCHPKPGDQTTFESGKLGMYVNTLSYISTAKKIKDFEWNIAPLASGPKNSLTRLGFAAYVMFKDDDESKIEERFKLFKYLTSKEQMTVTAQYFLPPRKSILSSAGFKKIYPDNIQDSFQITILDRLNNSRVAATPPNFIKINPEVQVVFDLLNARTITVKEALVQMEDKVNELLK